MNTPNPENNNISLMVLMPHLADFKVGHAKILETLAADPRVKHLYYVVTPEFDESGVNLEACRDAFNGTEKISLKGRDIKAALSCALEGIRPNQYGTEKERIKQAYEISGEDVVIGDQHEVDGIFTSTSATIAAEKFHTPKDQTGKFYKALKASFPDVFYVNDPAQIARMGNKLTLIELAQQQNGCDVIKGVEPVSSIEEMKRKIDKAIEAGIKDGRVVFKRPVSDRGLGIFFGSYENGKYLLKYEKFKPVYTLHAEEFRDTDCIVTINLDSPKEFDGIRPVFEADKQWLACDLLDIERGDQRVIVVDGEPIGAYIVKSPPGSQIANYGDIEFTGLTPQVMKTMEVFGKILLANGIRWAGLDMMADSTGRRWVTDVNTHNPGGLDLIAAPGSDEQVKMINKIANYIVEGTQQHLEAGKISALNIHMNQPEVSTARE